jgi:hypothetical protein
MLSLLGLHDDYRSDGRVLTEFLTQRSLPESLRENAPEYQRLAAAYKQLDAGVGSFAAATLRFSQKGVSSSSAGDATYLADEAQLAALGSARDALAGTIAGVLDQAAFGHREVGERQSRQLVKQADDLIATAQGLAAAA